MDSIFDAEGRRALLARLDALRPDTPRQWGTMTPAQALAHLVPPLEVAVGERTLPRSLIGVFLGRLVLKRALSDKPWGHGMPTDASFVVSDERDFESERERVALLLERFGTGGPSGITQGAHPFFGRMTPEQWDRLQWKHVDHHLRQFGA
ncbi:MAG: DUF1569 domain-containing protein [Planctomycetes bacterium]|nr:DUF1569 domain-containing protein [Planctomycetota bacterium]